MTITKRYIYFTSVGLAALIVGGLLISLHQSATFKDQIIETSKDNIKQALENMIERRYTRIQSIAESIIGFYEGSELVEPHEFMKFSNRLLENNKEITALFVLRNGEIIQSYPNDILLGENFDDTFTDYPIKIDGGKKLATEFVINNDLVVVIVFPFDYFITEEDFLDNNYKLILKNPNFEDLVLYQIEKLDSIVSYEDVVFSDEELENSIMLTTNLDIIGYKIEEPYILEYIIWDDSFEKHVLLEDYIILIGGIIMAIIIPYSRIRNAHLKKLAEERAMKLKKAYEEIKKIDKQKEEFSAMISHELKTPIVPMQLYTEMMMKETLGAINEKQKKALTSIHRNVGSLQNLINDVLDATKIDLNKLTLNKEDHLIEDMVNENIEIANLFKQEKNISIQTNIQTAGTVYCDKKRISQVLTNLIKNSIDFVPENDGKITVQVQDDEENVLFTVEDNGPGIPEEEQKNLFKKFYQKDTSMTRKHGGTGLGLVICQGIIKSHGGDIWYNNKNKLGASFKFYIPRNKK